MITAFTFMAHQLVRDVLPARTPVQRPGRAASKTSAIRDLLREQGPLTSQVIAVELGLDRPALVGALLKHDLAIGRIVRRGDCYALSDSWEESYHQEVADAIKLLRRQGYLVQRADA